MTVTELVKALTEALGYEWARVGRIAIDPDHIEVEYLDADNRIRVETVHGWLDRATT